MLTAMQARFIHSTMGRSNRFVGFAVSAFEAGFGEYSSASGTNLAALWERHFGGTAFQDDHSIYAEIGAGVLICQAVDGLKYYLADAAAWALQRLPDTTGLREEAKSRSAREGVDIDQAIREIAWQRAEDVSCRGFPAAVAFLESTFGLQIELPDDLRERLTRLIAVRNCLVHNNGRKNARYCRVVHEPATCRGKPIQPTLSEANQALDDISAFVGLADLPLSHALHSRVQQDTARTSGRETPPR